MKPTTSIIIRTYNEDKMIGRCLTAVYNQQVEHPIEVIIVDSGSSDRTLEIVSEYPAKKVAIEKEKFTFGGSLNSGCKEAQGKNFVFLSAHTVPQGSTWLETLVGSLQSQDVAGAFCKQIPHEDCNPLSKRQILAHWNGKSKDWLENFSFPLSGAAIKKEVWQKTPFNEELIASEDYDWAQRVKKQGYSIVYEPEAVIRHSHNENYRQSYDRNFREIYTNLLITGKKISFNFLILGFYHFCYDILYIIKNRYNLVWIGKSAMVNALLIFAAGRAMLKRLM